MWRNVARLDSILEVTYLSSLYFISSMAAPVPQEGSYLLVGYSRTRTQLSYRASHPRGGHQVRDHPWLITRSNINVHIASIRNRLTVLKRDRGEYIKPSDVNSLYQSVVKQGLSFCIRSSYQPLMAAFQSQNLMMSGRTIRHITTDWIQPWLMCSVFCLCSILPLARQRTHQPLIHRLHR
jgi:hypothetical protein